MKAVFTGRGEDLEVECTSIEKDSGMFIIHPTDEPEKEIWLPMSKIDMVVITKDKPNGNKRSKKGQVQNVQ